MAAEPRRKRLIEVAFPLAEVSEHSRREKTISQRHISTLHIWWARRPLAACRAFIYASLVDDPGDEQQRGELLKEVADLASWDAVRNPERIVRSKQKGGSGLTGVELQERARERILRSNGGKPPRLLDPFAGGGAIPLEALRLGCDVTATDINPVAVLVLKGTIEYPQKYGRPDSRPLPSYIHAIDAGESQSRFENANGATAYGNNPLATDVRYWGNWVIERARAELASYYPEDPDGSQVVAYMWSRTVPCPNCGAEMPLLRQYWLARTEKKKIWLEPVLDHIAKRVEFKIMESSDGAAPLSNPAQATTSRGDTQCLLCRQVVKAAYVHDVGRQGLMGARPTCVVVEGPKGGKRFRKWIDSDTEIFELAQNRAEELENVEIDGIPVIPDEPLAYHPQYMLVREYGLDRWGKLFNARQLVALICFSRLVREAYEQMRQAGLQDEYAKAVTMYLGLLVDKLAIRGSTCGVWHASGLKVENSMGDGTLPLVWDYPEANLIGGGSGSAEMSLRFLVGAIEEASKVENPATVQMLDARKTSGEFDFILTDPPYYDAINYADLSDFFYVWQKRSIGFLYPEILSLPLTPKRDQIVMNVYLEDSADKTSSVLRTGKERNLSAKGKYVQGMADALAAIRSSASGDAVTSIVFAHTDPDAWATLLEALLANSLVPNVSWPIDTEQQSGSTKQGKAKLKTSVWMVCHPRRIDEKEAFLGDLVAEMQPVIRERLLYFWSKGIRGADFFISAIGPALSVYGRHPRVLRPDGSVVTVREFLDLVRREAAQVALEQVLHGADLGQVDPLTRQYVTWVWSYSRAPLDAGEAIALCLASGADYAALVRPHSIATEVKEKSKKTVQLRTIRERAANDEDLSSGTPAKPLALIDQLQYAAWLWAESKTSELSRFRASMQESRWSALQTLGQAVAGCLADGDEDKRLINGLLSSGVARANNVNPAEQPRVGTERLPGF